MIDRISTLSLSSVYRTLGLSDPSVYRNFGLSDPRSIGPAVYQTLGLKDPQSIGPSVYRAVTSHVTRPFNEIHLKWLVQDSFTLRSDQGKNYMGTPGDFASEMQKRALAKKKKKKSPSKLPQAAM